MKKQLDRIPLGWSVLTGVLLAVGLLLAYHWGFFTTWQPIDSPPLNEYTFAGVYQAGFGTGNLVVRAADGQLYGYVRANGHFEWRNDINARLVVAAPCPARKLAARLKQPFTQPESCLETLAPAEWTGGTRNTYVRDNAGRLWQWSLDAGGAVSFLALPVILTGMLCGYLFSLVANPLILALRTDDPQVRAANRVVMQAWLERSMRVGARVWSIFSVVLLLGLYIAPDGFTQAKGTAGIFYVISLLIGMVGLAAAWRWERLGAWAALVCFATGLVGWVQMYPDEVWIALVILGLVYAPAGLFLTAWAYKRQRISSHTESMV